MTQGRDEPAAAFAGFGGARGWARSTGSVGQDEKVHFPLRSTQLRKELAYFSLLTFSLKREKNLQRGRASKGRSHSEQLREKYCGHGPNRSSPPARAERNRSPSPCRGVSEASLSVQPGVHTLEGFTGENDKDSKRDDEGHRHATAVAIAVCASTVEDAVQQAIVPGTVLDTTAPTGEGAVTTSSNASAGRAELSAAHKQCEQQLARRPQLRQPPASCSVTVVSIGETSRDVKCNAEDPLEGSPFSKIPPVRRGRGDAGTTSGIHWIDPVLVKQSLDLEKLCNKSVSLLLPSTSVFAYGFLCFLLFCVLELTPVADVVEFRVAYDQLFDDTASSVIVDHSGDSRLAYLDAADHEASPNTTHGGRAHAVFLPGRSFVNQSFLQVQRDAVKCPKMRELVTYQRGPAYAAWLGGGQDEQGAVVAGEGVQVTQSVLVFNGAGGTESGPGTASSKLTSSTTSVGTPAASGSTDAGESFSQNRRGFVEFQVVDHAGSGPFYLNVEIRNFFQSHMLYSWSMDEEQLKSGGEKLHPANRCKQLESYKFHTSGSRPAGEADFSPLFNFPCGLLPMSMLNDTFSVELKTGGHSGEWRRLKVEVDDERSAWAIRGLRKNPDEQTTIAASGESGRQSPAFWLQKSLPKVQCVQKDFSVVLPPRDALPGEYQSAPASHAIKESLFSWSIFEDYNLAAQPFHSATPSSTPSPAAEASFRSSGTNSSTGSQAQRGRTCADLNHEVQNVVAMSTIAGLSANRIFLQEETQRLHGVEAPFFGNWLRVGAMPKTRKLLGKIRDLDEIPAGSAIRLHFSDVWNPVQSFQRNNEDTKTGGATSNSKGGGVRKFAVLGSRSVLGGPAVFLSAFCLCGGAFFVVLGFVLAITQRKPILQRDRLF
ncbi:unnamed protein product [Amoebophrya sp. A120]|nr:unnamed protein product [Amoebophrya sp. A120]|eukprot:GSA120T00015348001.1